MPLPIVVAGIALAAWSAVVTIVSLWALVEPAARPMIEALGARFARWQTLPALGPSELLVLRPCAGRDANLQHNLRSIASGAASLAASKLSVRCVFAVHDEGDPAYAEALAARAWLETQQIKCELVVTNAEGPNHKVDQLARAQASSDREGTASIVIVVDSDVDLSDVDLSGLVAPLSAGTHAALWCPVPERGAQPTLGDRASIAILSGGLHAFAILSRLDPAGMVGKLFAVRADALSSVGGFAALKRHLGEDVELSRRLRAARLRVGARVLGAYSSAQGRSLSAVRDRYARWLLVVRMQRSVLLGSYPLLFFASPLQALASIALAPFALRVALGLLVSIVCVRTLVAIVARSASRLPWSTRAALIDPWLGDALLAFAWARSLTIREVSWRSSKVRFDREGLLIPERRDDEPRASA